VEWQLIGTAPKDGTEILGAYSYTYDCKSEPITYGPWTIHFDAGKWMASWDNLGVIESEGCRKTNYKIAPIEPTHWMPLPDLPKG
jgi:hypothetical protein